MAEKSGFVVGREVGDFGRWFRLVVGVYFTALLTIVPLLKEPPAAAGALSFLGQVVGYTLLILVVYLIGFWLLGEHVLAQTNPWIGTLIFLGPYSVIAVMGIGPAAFRVALGVYINISLIFNFAMSYGGCEVLAIPSLIFQRRYTVYCPYNAVDAVENALLIEPGRDLFMALASIAIAFFVGGYFLIAETLGMLGPLGVSVDLDNRWALLLLIPLAYLLRNAFLISRQSDQSKSGYVRALLVGAGVLATLILIFVGGLSYEPFWGIAMFGGGLAALGTALYRRIRWTKTSAEA